MVARKSVCLRCLAGGKRPQQVQFGRFIANQRVTVEAVIEGWSDQTRGAVKGLHVLAIQDTSEIKFATAEENRRGLGKIKKGNAYGVLLHPMLAVDAQSEACLGLVTGTVWTRGVEPLSPHAQRPLCEKESNRWIATAQNAKEVLAEAAMVTFVGDRENDLFAAWAKVPGDNIHLLTRVMHDHAILGGGTLRQAAQRQPIVDWRSLDLRERAVRKPRRVTLGLRLGTVELKRPRRTLQADLPKSVPLSFVEVIEQDAPKNVEPVHWLLLTTHQVENAQKAWQIIAWYQQRWIIEQFFRTMKTQALKIEDSQLQTAERLMKLTAIAARAAAITIQLVQARSGAKAQPATLAFAPVEIEALKALNGKLQGSTALQKNPHAPQTLAWAAWIIAKLGGWDGYPSSKPPGPITFHHGLTYFRAIATGWELRDVCIP
jgi:Transposase DDE domain